LRVDPAVAGPVVKKDRRRPGTGFPGFATALSVKGLGARPLLSSWTTYVFSYERTPAVTSASANGYCGRESYGGQARSLTIESDLSVARGQSSVGWRRG